MALESATYATQLVTTNPQSTDSRSQGDDHLRMIKTTLSNELSHTNAQWTYTGHAVTWQASTRLTVAGNQTDVYSQDRRIRVDGASVGSIYGNVASSTFSANTNINIRWDSTAASNETITTWVGDMSREGWPLGPETFVSGEWTPVFISTSPGDLSVAYSIQSGDYRRVGPMVYIHCTLQFTPTFTTASGEVRITGLPYERFNNVDGAADLLSAQLDNVNYPSGRTHASGLIGGGVTGMRFRFSGDGVSSVTMNMTHMQSGVQQVLRATGWYIVT